MVPTASLEVGKEYQIKHFRLMQTKFGPRLTVHFTEGIFCFLPPRFSVKIKTEEQLKELNQATDQCFKFEGKDASRGGFLKLNFYKKSLL